MKCRILQKFVTVGGALFSTPAHLCSFYIMAARCGRLFRSIYRPLRLLLRYGYWQCRNDSFSSHVNEFFRSAPKEITTSMLYRHCAQLVGERSAWFFDSSGFLRFFPALLQRRRFRNWFARDQSYNEDALFRNSVALFYLYFWII